MLSELGKLNSKEGQIILGAAVIDDVLGIIVLAVVASLAKDGVVDVGNVIYLIVSASAFLIGAIVFGNVFNKSFVAIADKLKTRGELVHPCLHFCLHDGLPSLRHPFRGNSWGFCCWVSSRGNRQTQRTPKASYPHC